MKARYSFTALLVAIAGFASCSVDHSLDQYGDISQVTAIVTVKKSPDDTVYFQLSDTKTVYPLTPVEYTGRQRALCTLSLIYSPIGSYDYTAHVGWLEPIEEGVVTSDKPASQSAGMDILDDWMTSVEDGYLTLRYATWWGVGTNILHKFSVITGQDPDDPYSIILHHDASGDRKDAYKEALVCFDINTLPDTDGQYVPLTLTWTRTDGSTASHTFDFKTRK